MKINTPTLLLALLLAPLALLSQPQQKPTPTVRDHLWLFRIG
jgi:hypothetical protein